MIDDMALVHRFFPGLILPCTADQLKQAFWTASHRLHPDKSGDAGLFVEMKALYDVLRRDPDTFVHQTTDAIPVTITGEPLSELGLGLGPLVNGKDCPGCDHNGFTSYRDHAEITCPVCRGRGYTPKVRVCWPCLGSGVLRKKPTVRYAVCSECKGTGEIQIWNPLLPKGRLNAGS